MKKLCSLLLLSAVLSGCVTSNILMLPKTANDPTLLSGGKGLLLVQVADTTPLGTRYPANQLTLAPKNFGESAEVKLPRSLAVESLGSSSRWFLAALPENEYSVESLRTYYNLGAAYVAQWYPGDIELGTFRVESGKLTDLGVLTIYIDRQGEDYSYATRRASSRVSKSALEALQAAYPELFALIDNTADPLTWEYDGFESERLVGYRVAVNRQVTLGDPRIDVGSGEVVYPGHLGVILRRETGGTWLLDAFDDDLRINHYEKAEGREFIATELSELYSRPFGPEQPWALVNTDDVEGDIVFMTAHPAGGLLLITEDEGQKTITFWHSESFGASWRRLSDFTPVSGFWDAMTRAAYEDTGVTGASFIKSGDYLYMAMYENLYKYSFYADSVEEVKVSTPVSMRIRNDVLTITRSGWMASGRHSHDKGLSWGKFITKVLSPSYTPDQADSATGEPGKKQYRSVIGHPVFINPLVAYSTHSAKEDEPRYLLKSVDAGATWVPLKSVELPEGCAILELIRGSEILLRCSLSGEFYRSDDEGASWTLERSVSEL